MIISKVRQKKILNKVQKTLEQNDLWLENQVCRICGQIMNLFTWNGNNLKEYWRNIHV